MKVSCDELVSAIDKVIPKKARNNIVFMCIGTDRSTGDSLGPLVGTKLAELGYQVIGTIDDPCHATNLAENIEKLNKDQIVIAIDACLGGLSSVGTYRIDKGPLSPGAGVNKILPKVGDYHINGIVNVGGFMEYVVLQNTRLSLVIKMAKSIVDAISTVFPSTAIQQIAISKEGESQ